MSKYKISMDYNEFQRLEKSQKSLTLLCNRLRSCIDYQSKPMMINIKELKKIAIEQLPFEVDEGDIFVDV